MTDCLGLSSVSCCAVFKQLKKIKLINHDKPLNRNLGKAGIQELNAMLEKLGLKRREE